MSERSIEDAIKDVLTGDTRKNALDFAAYLKANGMTTDENHSEVRFMDKCVCYMYLDGAENAPGPWTVWTDGDYSRVPQNGTERLREIAWGHVNYCASCGGKCSPGSAKTIFGRGFDNVCGADMAFTNPDEETLECVKWLLDIRKTEIAGR